MALLNFHGNRKKKFIALTFDDAPSKETASILKVLKKYNVRATFFVCGNRIKNREKLIGKIINSECEIGNHGWGHRALWFLRRKKIERDILKCDNALGKVGVITDLFRPPYFRTGPNLILTCRKLKKKIIFCDVASDDYKIHKNETSIINRVLMGVKNGSIINLHDYLVGIGRNKRIVKITDAVLNDLSQQGYKFITVSEILR